MPSSSITAELEPPHPPRFHPLPPRYGLYGPLKQNLAKFNNGDPDSFLTKVMSGTCAGTFAQAMCNPTDLLKACPGHDPLEGKDGLGVHGTFGGWMGVGRDATSTWWQQPHVHGTHGCPRHARPPRGVVSGRVTETRSASGAWAI